MTGCWPTARLESPGRIHPSASLGECLTVLDCLPSCPTVAAERLEPPPRRIAQGPQSGDGIVRNTRYAGQRR